MSVMTFFSYSTYFLANLTLRLSNVITDVFTNFNYLCALISTLSFWVTSVCS